MYETETQCTKANFVLRHIILLGSDENLKHTGCAEPTLDVIMRCIREDLDCDFESSSNNAGRIAVRVSEKKLPTKFDAVISGTKSLISAVLNRR